MSKETSIVTDEQINTYLESMGNKLTQSHRNQFIEMAKSFNLNPFKREIYGIAYGNNFNIIVGYEVFIKRAECSGQLSGWRAWVEGTGSDLKACIEIHRKDWNQPFYHEVYISEYHQNNQMWKTKTRTMLKKVVIGQGFRLCFSVDLGGLPYLEEEVSSIAESKEKNITPANKEHVELPALDDEKFTNTYSAFLKAVESGKKTTQDIINSVSSTWKLRQEQIEAIEDIDNIIAEKKKEKESKEVEDTKKFDPNSPEDNDIPFSDD